MDYLKSSFVLVLMFLLTSGQAESKDLASLSAELRTAISENSVRQHLEMFQIIADANDGNRSAGTKGYDASADYVKSQLEAAGYEVELQAFELENFRVIETVLEYPSGKAFSETDIATMQFSGSGELSAKVQAVDVQLSPNASNNSTSGCEARDFNGFQAGNIALLQRGVCTFQSKVDRAVNAGAGAVIIFNEGQAGRRDLFGGTLVNQDNEIPVIAASFQVGQELAESEPELYLKVDASLETKTTHNVLAESKTGNPDSVLMIGAHLDSVVAGPGIHDNGSGSAAILELALQLANGLQVNEDENELESRLRFAWWGAEELGLLGSRHYIDTLASEDLERLQAYINLDMVGSPNFVRLVYDGDGSDRSSRVPLEEGSAEIEALYLDYFQSQSLSVDPTAIFAGSDHRPFAEAGVPIGGVFTGASQVKTSEEASQFGGKASEPYDACYHQACDTINNIDFGVLEQMTDATADVILNLAFQSSSSIDR